jgi:hypothetical protein
MEQEIYIVNVVIIIDIFLLGFFMGYIKQAMFYILIFRYIKFILNKGFFN